MSNENKSLFEKTLDVHSRPLFIDNRSIYNNDEYHKIHISFDHTYKDIEVYIKKIDVDKPGYDFYLFDKSNYTRYKISLSELIKESDKYGTITKNELDKIADPIDGQVYYGFSDKFDLIKDMQFDKELYLYVKKALIPDEIMIY